MARGGEAVVEIVNYRELRRAMLEYGPNAKVALKRTMAHVAERLLPRVQATVAFDKGKLASSYRVYGGVRGSLIGSPLIYAPIAEFAHAGPYASLTEKHGPVPRALIPTIRDNAPEIGRAVEHDLQHLLDTEFGTAEP